MRRDIHVGNIDVPQVRVISHGTNLQVTDVGPWALQTVPKGSEVLDVVPSPARGFWRVDTPVEYSPTGTYVYNNNPANKGGVVPAGGMTIDGYTVPAGTVVTQFRDLSATDFSAQSMGGSYVFRGCRFRNGNIGQSSQFNDYRATYTNRLLFCDIGGPEPASLSTWKAAFWKMIGGSGHVMHRNHCSSQYVTFQLNANNSQCIENYITDLTWYYGDSTPPGQSEALHMSSVGAQGGVTGLRVLRNYITCPSPDPLGTVFTQGAALTFGNDIDVPWSDVWIKDNHLSGMGYVIRLFGEYPGQNNLQVTGNRVTTRWFTNGGASGVAQTGDFPVTWGSDGNVKSDNTWADDFGAGGNGSGTPISARQYPSGNGPRRDTNAF